MATFLAADVLAALWFLAVWTVYGFVIEHTRWAGRSLNGRMDTYRRVWMRRMVEREVRILDSTVMASLQNGAAFFASTALIALGGTLSLLRAADDALSIFGALPFGVAMTRAAWETKIAGLAVIFAYAFFKFAWSYRLMNYSAILIAATPNTFTLTDPETAEMAERAAGMNRAAGAQFNSGQRAFFLALGYLGWFISPAVFVVTTTVVLVIMIRRQFGSAAVHALGE